MVGGLSFHKTPMINTPYDDTEFYSATNSNKWDMKIFISGGYIKRIETNTVEQGKALTYNFDGPLPNGLFEINMMNLGVFNVVNGYFKGRFFFDGAGGTFRDGIKFTGFKDIPSDYSLIAKGEYKTCDDYDSVHYLKVPSDDPYFDDDFSRVYELLVPEDDSYFTDEDENEENKVSIYFVIDGKYEGPAIVSEYQSDRSCETCQGDGCDDCNNTGDIYLDGIKIKVLRWYDQGREVKYATYSNKIYRYMGRLDNLLNVVVGDNKIQGVKDVIMGYHEPYDTFKIYLDRLYRNNPHIKGSAQISSIRHLLK